MCKSGKKKEITELACLEELIEQDVFELLTPAGEDCRLVYLMNDAVESFLVFQDSTLTGTYEPDNEEERMYQLAEDDTHWVLIVHQGEGNVFTIRFSDLVLSTQLFEYGTIGHFWRDGYEYLRELEYHLAILRDKWLYLGDAVCTEKEQRLAKMADFAPLWEYPAVPDAYRLEREHPWCAEANEQFAALAQLVGDEKLHRIAVRYAAHPTKHRKKKIARLLRKKVHGAVVDALIRQVAEASAHWPRRVFPPEQEAAHRALAAKADAEQARLASAGIRSERYRQEPFLQAQDSVTYEEHVMVWSECGRERVVEIHTYPPRKEEK